MGNNVNRVNSGNKVNKADMGKKVNRVNMGNNKFNKVKIERKKDGKLEEKGRGGHFGPRQRFKQFVMYLVFGMYPFSIEKIK